MSKGERIRRLLVSMLETLADATIDMETEDMDCGTLHFPVLKYIPTFEFSDEDIRLIKTLGKEELEDFSVLTEI